MLQSIEVYPCDRRRHAYCTTGALYRANLGFAAATTMTEVITELEADGGEDSALFGEDIYSATSLLLGEDSPGKKEVSLADNLPPKCVSFHNISYHVKQRRFFKKLPPKTILHNIR